MVVVVAVMIDFLHCHRNYYCNCCWLPSVAVEGSEMNATTVIGDAGAEMFGNDVDGGGDDDGRQPRRRSMDDEVIVGVRGVYVTAAVTVVLGGDDGDWT